jgi:nucleotide-binding universal stress UspA family protein
MTIALAALAALAIGALAWGLVSWGRARPAQPGSERRILFPFAGDALSEPALDAALRLANAEQATIVPVVLAKVPRNLPLDSSLPRQAGRILPCLDAVEQRAGGKGVPVDSRIERGRTLRHAIQQLIEHEHFDQIVVAAATNGANGLSAADVAWLLDYAPGEIVVLRPARSDISPHLAESAAAHL